jgi:hypothetical protein
MPRLERAVTGLLIAIFATMTGVASLYPSTARLMPLTVGIPAILLATWQLRREWSAEALSESRSLEPAFRPEEVTAIAWFVLFVLLIVAGGFVIGGVIAVAASQRFWLKEPRRTVLTSAAVAFAILQGGLVWGMGLPLFEGIVTGWVERWLGL